MSIPYKRIVTALDGSKPAECAIPHAVALAECSGAELVLLCVVEPISDRLRSDGHPRELSEQLEMHQASALAYLNGVRYRIAGRPLTINVAVEVGAAADAILDYAGAHEVDVLVMATHGRSGAKRWLLGSVASKVLQRSVVPVLLVRVTP